MTREELRRQIHGVIRQAFDAGVRHERQNKAADLGLLGTIAVSHVEAFLEAEAKRANEARGNG